jgi:hypothetical protein
MNSSIHPDAVLQSILETGPRPQKLHRLNAIHEICRVHYEAGERDFSLVTIGALCKRQDVFKAPRGLYNEPAADYRKLIAAWGTHAGPAPVRQKQNLATDEFVQRIEDPAIRLLVQRTISERNKLKNQLDVLKAAKTIIVDRRPVAPSDLQPSREAQLTDSERQALKKAISETFLRSRGWEETKLGEIITETGRTMFDPGFATGLRKLLGE